jgi:hypothetical protein
MRLDQGGLDQLETDRNGRHLAHDIEETELSRIAAQVEADAPSARGDGLCM